VQIEINRALYMDECTREPNADFRATQNAIDNMLSQIAAWIKCRTA
jgi:N-formylglutamate amidohydrolase